MRSSILPCGLCDHRYFARATRVRAAVGGRRGARCGGENENAHAAANTENISRDQSYQPRCTQSASDLSPRANPSSGPVDALAQRDDLEELAHFRGRDELLRLRGERRVGRHVLGRGLREQRGEAAVHQELRLVRVAQQVHARFPPGLRDRREVDVAGDVLQAREEERIVVRAMAVVAHQRALGALRVVELAPREAVVEEECRAARRASRPGCGRTRARASWISVR